MKRRGLILLAVLLWCTSAWASNSMQNYVGNWNDPNGWSEGYVPTGAEEVKVRGTTVCTLNTDTGDWGDGQRMRVYEGATLNVEDGASLLGAGWMRVGSDGSSGTLNQTGGLVMVQDGKDTAKLEVGDKAGTQGTYTISGGTMSYNSSSRGDLVVGGRSASGTLTIVGSAPVITMNNLEVCDQAGSTGILDFQLDVNGVSPITLDGDCTIDSDGADSNALLVVEAVATPPEANIVLVDLGENGSISGAFDNVAEGDLIQVMYRGNRYFYQLTFSGGDDGKDIALLYNKMVPEPMALDSQSVVARYALDGDANNSSGNGLNGTLMGEPNFIVDSNRTALQLDGVDDYVDLGSDSAFDLTQQITLAAWVKPQDIGNGEDNPYVGKGDHSYAIKGFRNGNVVEFYIYDSGWYTAHADVGANFNNEWHHVAGSYDGTQLKIYIDGALIATTDHVGTIASSTSAVNIGKNSDKSDRFYEGDIDDVVICKRAISGGQVAYLAGYRAVPYAPGDINEVAYYPFTQAANDVSPNGHNGTLMGSPMLVYGPDDYGFAYLFGGQDSNDAIDTGIHFNPIGSFTVALWANGSDWADGINMLANTMLADYGDVIDSVAQGINLSEFNTGAVSFKTCGLTTDVDADVDGTMASVGQLPQNEWVHITAVYNADTHQKLIYLNGVLDSIGTVSLDSQYVPSALTVHIGALSTADGQGVAGSFNGILDEVMIYDRALSTGEIQYISGNTGK